MYISVAKHGKRNGSIVRSILPTIYMRPGPVQVRTWTFPQADPHCTGSRRSCVNARPIWTQSGTGPKFIRSGVNGAIITLKGFNFTFFFVLSCWFHQPRLEQQQQQNQTIKNISSTLRLPQPRTFSPRLRRLSWHRGSFLWEYLKLSMAGFECRTLCCSLLFRHTYQVTTFLRN